ncbi:MAG TPA: ribulose-phosphate 3-epimerase [Tepidisphaeraceae bacterium]|nr:ribulose-phosphate 3-epimerase [Tepidisphaeraceae bacterium]
MDSDQALLAAPADRVEEWSDSMNGNVFQHPPHLPLIAPSILAADFARLGAEAADVEKAGADLLHVDIMDGHFVPNLTMGPDIVMALARSSGLMQDVHLMVSNPDEHIDLFAKAGAKNMTFHIEVRNGASAVDLIKRIHDLGCTAGVSLNPATPVEDLTPILGHADMILVMSVVPGFTGQAFMPEVLEKVKALHDRMGPHQRLEIDGGIGIRTAHQALEAGADVLVAGAAVFRNPERAQTIKLLRGDYPK